MSQAALARELENRGLPFRQQTIVKVEKGQRPLRLIEAEEIANALEVDIQALVAIDDEPRFDRLANVIRHTGAVRAAWAELEEKAIAMHDAQSVLSHALMFYRSNANEVAATPPGVLGDAETMLAVDPLEVVRRVPAKLAARYAAQEAEADSAVVWRDFGEEGQAHALEIAVGSDDDADFEAHLDGDIDYDDEADQPQALPLRRGMPGGGEALPTAARKTNEEPGLKKARREHDEAAERIEDDRAGMEPS